MRPYRILKDENFNLTQISNPNFEISGSTSRLKPLTF